jgi:hypothetical protein
MHGYPHMDNQEFTVYGIEYIDISHWWNDFLEG